ncbi:DMT family transporter [Pseudomonas schmalbachii]|uniref:DMT family transporter n=1 Tax=Pseudomonas schmalbachii TaxID=2816993 RepID=A0ABS3TMA0_9PSED|nr:DMT family transporter [Pseudomonas schmalbachii]MBO3274789.1 DMT family transporter [Pseudomonas schmalbachii]
MNGNLGGWLSGFLGVLIFSGSLPATRVAVGTFDPTFLTLARASIAGLVAAAILLLLRQQRPHRRDLLPLLVVAGGVVVGFPLLTALALQHVSSAHAIVFVGLLPLCTALFGVLRAGERPRPAFWLFSLLGSGAVAGYALAQGGQASLLGDLLMLAAILACGLGYAEGARLARHLGSWQVICWVLVLSLPLMLPLTFWTLPGNLLQADWPALASLAYVSLFSMLIGFFFWYHGLAKGGIAAVGQLQLLQPFFGLALAALLLHESVSPLMAGVTLAVICCVMGARRFAR